MKLVPAPLPPEAEANRASHEALIADIRAAAEAAAQGGGEKARERHVSRGKMLPRDRVAALLDPGSPFLEVGATAAQPDYQDVSLEDCSLAMDLGNAR